MTPETLGAPVVTGAAVRSVNFFNGRLLTGEDLRAEQVAVEARAARLGRAVGDGVAYGLEVSHATGSSTATRPVVTVEPGLAIAPSGQTLELTTAVDVSLARPGPVPEGEPGGLFADCQPHAPGTYTAGAGVYLLAIGPARQGEGRAPVSGLGNEPAPCNTAVSVEAVRFRLIRLALPPAEILDRARLRNRVAYRCFGHGPTANVVRDPFNRHPREGTLVDVLRAQTLPADEVPLALIGWAAGEGVHFVDRWSVRRRVAAGAADPALPLFPDDRRRADAEACFEQFADHVADLRSTQSAQTVVAAQHFDRLPPAGLLPIGGGSSVAFDFGMFFAGTPFRDPAVLEGARAVELLDDARAYPPIELSRGEMVWLYLVRENVQPSGPGAPFRFLLFTNGQIPYRADARFELAYWNFANYAEVD